MTHYPKKKKKKKKKRRETEREKFLVWKIDKHSRCKDAPSKDLSLRKTNKQTNKKQQQQQKTPTIPP